MLFRSSQVETGVKQVHDAGDVLQAIVTQMAEIAVTAAEISHSTAEQSTSLRQINAAVSGMDKVTQQNAAMVEQTTAAARAMAGEAERLSAAVSQFDVSVEAERDTAQPIERPTAKRVRWSSGNAAAAVAVQQDMDDWSDF